MAVRIQYDETIQQDEAVSARAGDVFITSITDISNEALPPDWKVSAYAVGSQVAYSGKIYVCIIARGPTHTDNPAADNTGWAEIGTGSGGGLPPEWVVGVYAAGDQVAYESKIYVCILARTASDTGNPMADTVGWISVGANASGQQLTDAQIGNKALRNPPAPNTTSDAVKETFRQAIDAGTSDFSGDYDDLTNKPTIPVISNDFTDAEQTKLAGIETGATQDQTATEIKDSLETLTDDDRLDASAVKNIPATGLTAVTSDDTLTGDGTSTDTLKVANPFTAADETKLDGIAAGAEVNVQSDWDETDNSSDAFIRNKPTVSNDFTDEDHTKLDGIEDNATQDQTATEIRDALMTLERSARLSATAIKGLPSLDIHSDDTITGVGTTVDPLKVANPFTAADETKLDGIAVGATADYDATNRLDAAFIADGTVSNAEFQYINGLTSDAQVQFGNITANVALLQANVITLGTDISDNEDAIANVVSDLANTDALVANTATSTALSALVLEVANNESNIANVVSDLSNTDANVANAVSDISNVVMSVANTDANVTTLTNNLANTDANVVTLNSNLDMTNENVANAVSDIANVVMSVANTDANVANLDSDLANTDANVATVAGNLATTAADLATLAGRVTNIETAIPTFVTSANVNALQNVDSVATYRAITDKDTGILYLVEV